METNGSSSCCNAAQRAIHLGQKSNLVDRQRFQKTNFGQKNTSVRIVVPTAMSRTWAA